MNRFQLRIYLEELDKHAGWALEEFDKLKETEDAPAINVFSAAHQMLGHAGVVSRLLWPEEMVVPKQDRRHADKRHRRALARGSELRQQLAVDDRSPLNHPDLRLHITRFEERLDGWVDEVLDQIVLPAGESENLKGRRVGVVAEDVLRYYNADTGEFDLRGTVFQLQVMAEALSDLRLRIAMTIEERPMAV